MATVAALAAPFATAMAPLSPSPSNTAASSHGWNLRNANSPGAPAQSPFAYGAPGWEPVVGDWNGDGKTTIGVFDPAGNWYLRNDNSAGAPQLPPFAYGGAGWWPVPGAWGPLGPAPTGTGTGSGTGSGSGAGTGGTGGSPAPLVVSAGQGQVVAAVAA